MKPLLFPSLALAGGLVAACVEFEADPSSSSAASPTVVASAPSQEIPAELVKYNVNLPKKGDRLPDIQGLTLKGESIDNEWLEGKTALINLWFYH